MAWFAWKGNSREVEQAMGDWKRANERSASMHVEVREKAKQVSKAARQDKADYRAAIIEKASRAYERHDMREVYAAYKKLRPYVPKRLRMVELEDGATAATAVESSKRWQRHFAVLQQSKDTTWKKLKMEAEDADKKRWEEHARRGVASIPTVASVEQACALQKQRKAQGEDSLPPDVFKYFPREMAEAWTPVMVKSSAVLAEPLQWKGANKIHLWKGKGDPSKCQNSRQIVLADVAGKIYHRMLCQELEKSTVGAKRECQYGAVAG